MVRNGHILECILNVEPMKLAVDFTRGMKERRVKDECQVFIFSSTNDGIVKS